MTELWKQQSPTSELTFEQLCDQPEVIASVLKSIQQLGKQLELKPKEIPLYITLVKEEWNQDNNLLTAAMKMKRKQVNDFYRKDIQRMFQLTNNDSNVVDSLNKSSTT